MYLSSKTAIHAPTYYTSSIPARVPNPKIKGEHQADVCVVGAGLTGINTALELSQSGLKVILLEKHSLGWGASGRNGGQLIRGIGHEVNQLLPLVGTDGVLTIKRMGWESVQWVCERIQERHIDCDLVMGYADLANHTKDLKELEEERDNLVALGYPHTLNWVHKNDMGEVLGSSAFQGALLDEGSGHLNPLKLLLGEAQAAITLGVDIYENSEALTWQTNHQGFVVHTAEGLVRANTLVLACDAYQGLDPYLNAIVLPAESNIIATEPLPPERIKTLIRDNRALCDMKVVVDYFRFTPEGRLLFGGACRYSGLTPRNIKHDMRKRMIKIFPQLSQVGIDYAWGGMIGISANRFPQIGQHPQVANLYYAQGYSGHGLNVSHLAARLLCEAIVNQLSLGLDLFAKVPHLKFPGGAYTRAPLLALGMAWHRFKAWIR